MGFMVWLGDQSSTSPGSQPGDPPFCLRTPALYVALQAPLIASWGLAYVSRFPLVLQNIRHLGFKNLTPTQESFDSRNIYSKVLPALGP